MGWRARKLWSELSDQARSKHTFVENFKLALHDPERASALPSWLTAEQVSEQNRGTAFWKQRGTDESGERGGCVTAELVRHVTHLTRHMLCMVTPPVLYVTHARMPV
jgi:hypothetical protein